MRWLVLDEVVEIQKGKSARTRSRVPATNLAGKPETEASPEVLIIEMMAQTGGLLVGAENDFQGNAVFAKIEEAKFYPGFKTGEPLEIEALAENLRSEGSWITASVRSSGRPVAEAKLMLANAGELVPGIQESVTFHPAFMEHFKVRDKIK